jgi:hypothetical protein
VAVFEFPADFGSFKPPAYLTSTMIRSGSTRSSGKPRAVVPNWTVSNRRAVAEHLVSELVEGGQASLWRGGSVGPWNDRERHARSDRSRYVVSHWGPCAQLCTAANKAVDRQAGRSGPAGQHVQASRNHPRLVGCVPRWPGRNPSAQPRSAKSIGRSTSIPTPAESRARPNRRAVLVSLACGGHHASTWALDRRSHGAGGRSGVASSSERARF